MGGYTCESRLQEVANGLGLGQYLDYPLAVLSGGQRSKVALAKCLLKQADILSISQNGDIDIQKLDAYVSFDENNIEYKISDDAKDDLTESELQYLQTKVSETNILYVKC